MGRFGIAFLLLVIHLLFLSCTVCRALFSSNYTDESALLAFKSAITFDPNNVLGSNWTENTNFCQWVGVSCSRRHRQRVTALQLPRIGLHGTISPHVGNLSFLKMLHLRRNNFHGQLIHEISHLRRLKVLNLTSNYLEGEIPASLHHCQQLQLISLAGNEFTGSIPRELSTLSSLRVLFLGRNNLTGTIPSFFANMSSLKWLGLEENKFHGNIPNEICNVPSLEGINFGRNYYLTGSIPPLLFNISSLQQVLLLFNDLSGNLPLSSTNRPSNLKILNLGANQLSGNIPSYLSNFSMLNELWLGNNQFTGTVPTSLGYLESLTVLHLDRNRLTIEPRSQELSFLTSLTSLKSLERLVIQNNPFHGNLPDSFGNLSSSLLRFRASNCQLMGQIPEGIGSFTNLNYLILSGNNFNGSIPSTIEGMKELQRFHLDRNRLEGSIPKEICSLRNLGDIRLHNNSLSGSIPTCIGNVSRLQTLFLHSNSLNSSIPLSLWSLDNLLFLNLSFNSLTLDPDIRALKSLEVIDLSWNQISGNIPSTLGAFESLSSINLSKNLFSGAIPESFGNLITLDFMDLSHNNLSGSIPKSLEALSHLKYLNLSYNVLSGEIPSGGPFENFTTESFMKNEALCGKPSLQVSPCSGSRTKHFPYKYVLPAIVTSVAICIALLYMVLKKYNGNKVQAQSSAYNLLDGMEHRLFSYQELCNATNNFCEANLIGIGGFGAVYKGILSDRTNVAVKILNLQLEEAFKSFEVECKVLRTVRHRNLVKVISTCSNMELKALVLQYMPNGSLEKWLYSHKYCLNLLQRVSIMLDVALALEYLHQGQLEPIVHCDLKPSNVLLDEDMVAHVGDFGIAKILAENKTATQTETLGIVGYIAPEYGSEGKVSTKGDIYSYGIMLLETFTRKNPKNEIFIEELSLRQWVSASLPHKIIEVIDKGLLIAGGDEMSSAQGIFVSIIELGLECSRELPKERNDIKEVVAKLDKIKLQLLCN